MGYSLFNTGHYHHIYLYFHLTFLHVVKYNCSFSYLEFKIYVYTAYLSNMLCEAAIYLLNMP